MVSTVHLVVGIGAPLADYDLAEGYYGNDYPEDELDSDDEFGRDTYKHWQSAFDDEEFEDKANWSDDEPKRKWPWNIK